MAEVDYNQLGKDILTGVGGESNVSSVVHCATRMRFRLKDRDKAAREQIEKLPGVITVVESGGQFQVVIGNNVPKAYAALPASLTSDAAAAADAGPKGNILNRAVDVLSSIFAPILGAMAAVGILKGLLAMATTFGWIAATSTTYQILFAIADGFFLLLPMFLAVTTARKFGGNIYTAMTLAAALLYTSLQSMVQAIKSDAGTPLRLSLKALFDAGNPVDFLGIPVTMVSYTSSVIPIILAVWVLTKVEKVCNRFIHEAVRNFITPMIALVVVMPLTLIVIGPITTWLANSIADGIVAIQSFSPVLMGALIGLLWQVLVVFGVHWGFVPIFINNIATKGFDVIKAAAFPAVLAQAGAALGVTLRVKDPRAKALAGSATLAGIFGITEPAVYGVTLPRKRPFVIGILAGGVGGAITGIGPAVIYGSGAPSLLTLPLGFGTPASHNVTGAPVDGDTFIWLALGSAVAFFAAAIGTYFFGLSADDRAKDLVAAREAANAAEDDAAATALSAGGTATAVATLTHEVVSPIAGEVVPLEQVNDPVFASGTMGPGVAVRPVDGKVIAPFDGTVVVAMDTGHAVGLRSNDGIELLIHVGLDTVAMKGEGFTRYVERGQSVPKGTVLIQADLAAIKAAGYDPTTVVVVTNSRRFAAVTPAEGGETDQATTLLTLTR